MKIEEMKKICEHSDCSHKYLSKENLLKLIEIAKEVKEIPYKQYAGLKQAIEELEEDDEPELGEIPRMECRNIELEKEKKMENDLKHMYEDLGLSISEISLKLRYSREKTRSLLKKANVKIRTAGESIIKLRKKTHPKREKPTRFV